MTFWLDRDRMYACWTAGDEDLAMALASIDGFEVAHGGADLVDKHQHRDGFWERRIVYVTARRDRDRANKKRREERNAST